MLLQRTISQLDVGYVPEDVAERMGHLGYSRKQHGVRYGNRYPVG